MIMMTLINTTIMSITTKTFNNQLLLTKRHSGIKLEWVEEAVLEVNSSLISITRMITVILDMWKVKIMSNSSNSSSFMIC